MAKNVQIKENCSVYPGEYKPLISDILEVKKELHIPLEGACQPVTNVIECTDHYKIEFVAPGHSKDDFIVITHGDKLTVAAVRRESNLKELPVYRSHEFNYDCIEHSILLPENIDTDFARAEYNAGILCVCFPKTDKPVFNTFHQIIVY